MVKMKTVTVFILTMSSFGNPYLAQNKSSKIESSKDLEQRSPIFINNQVQDLMTSKIQGNHGSETSTSDALHFRGAGECAHAIPYALY